MEKGIGYRTRSCFLAISLVLIIMVMGCIDNKAKALSSRSSTVTPIVAPSLEQKVPMYPLIEDVIAASKSVNTYSLKMRVDEGLTFVSTNGTSQAKRKIVSNAEVDVGKNNAHYVTRIDVESTERNYIEESELYRLDGWLYILVDGDWMKVKTLDKSFLDLDRLGFASDILERGNSTISLVDGDLYINVKVDPKDAVMMSLDRVLIEKLQAADIDMSKLLKTQDITLIVDPSDLLINKLLMDHHISMDQKNNPFIDPSKGEERVEMRFVTDLEFSYGSDMPPIELSKEASDAREFQRL